MIIYYSTGNSTQCSVVTEMGRKSKNEWCFCFSCVLPFVTPWTVAHQVPLSMGYGCRYMYS